MRPLEALCAVGLITAEDYTQHKNSGNLKSIVLPDNISHGKYEVIEELYTSLICRELRLYGIPKFWSCFSESTLDFYTCMTNFHTAVTSIYDFYSNELENISLLEAIGLKSNVECPARISSKLKLLLKAEISAQLDPKFEDVIRVFYSQVCEAYNYDDHKMQGEGVWIDEIYCSGCNKEVTGCFCEEIKRIFLQINHMLLELDICDQMCGDIITCIIDEKITKQVQDTCKGSFDVPHLGNLERWLYGVMLRWLPLFTKSTVIGQSYSDCVEGKNDNRAKKLWQFLYKTYTEVRTEQLFNIIIEFPDSQPALEDLCECLKKTGMRSSVIKSLSQVFTSKLLHPGVNTMDILTAYVSAIKALRVLDPSGVILELVSDGIRKYLRSRKDTVRSIVHSLTDDSFSELTEELIKGEPLMLDENVEGDDTSTDQNWESWQPDPIDTQIDSRAPSRTSDIISMLVNIYGSKDLFINEYRSLLADRLLTLINFDTVREYRYLELLKVRFGDSLLHNCEVILKDVSDSHRINTHIMSEDNQLAQFSSFPVVAMIMSAQFWPTFKEDKLELPPIVKEHLDVYTRAFETLKGNRTLIWKHHLGTVELELELSGETLNLCVSPMHAAIIFKFEEKPEWSLEELSMSLRIPTGRLRKKMVYWQGLNIIIETQPDKFVLQEEPPPSRGGWANFINDVMNVAGLSGDEEESMITANSEQKEEELQIFWSYIVGMLTNLESMPLDRIHQMLKMVSLQGTPGSSEYSLQDLKAFLDKKVKSHELLFSSNSYRLPKN